MNETNRKEFEQAILANWQCVEGTVVRNGFSEWELKGIKNDD